ncbi:hypothetical protein ACUXST_001513 [Sphingomonas sp. F9_3S_D5_B_2]
MDYLYYWKLYASDTANGPIYKLNQNSPVMRNLEAGDDVWAIGRANGSYPLVARFTVVETGTNPLGSQDRSRYGAEFMRSAPALSTYFELNGNDAERIVRSLGISTASPVLGRSFQGGAAVRELDRGDRQKLVRYAATLRTL